LFDATTVVPASVRLENAAVKLRGNGKPQASEQDVNADGLLDLVVHVETQSLQLTEGDDLATLMAWTVNGDGIVATDSVRIVGALFGEAAGGVREVLTNVESQGHGSPVSLNDSDLDAVVPFAFSASWTGATHSSDASSIEVVIADLPDGMLGRAELLAPTPGQTSPGGRITLDRDANGAGWFIDQTPFDHSEFRVPLGQSLTATANSAATGRYDLLTVLRHEIGHLYGSGHDDTGLMAPILAPGVRYLGGGVLHVDDHGLRLPMRFFGHQLLPQARSAGTSHDPGTLQVDEEGVDSSSLLAWVRVADHRLSPHRIDRVMHDFGQDEEDDELFIEFDEDSVPKNDFGIALD